MTEEKQCNCVQNPFANLPPEMRPRLRKKNWLRKTTCPGCGREYWTNHSTDFCFDCETKAASSLHIKTTS